MKDIRQERVKKIKAKCHRWFIEAATGMAHGLFCTLIAGTIVATVGRQFLPEGNAFGALLINIGGIAQMLMGAGIGAGIAFKLKAPPLVIFSAVAAGTIGAWAPQLTGQYGWLLATADIMPFGRPGNPIGAYFAALTAVELVSSYIAGKTKLDIVLVPLSALVVALGAAYASLPLIWITNQIGVGVNGATNAQPFLMGIVIAVLVGFMLTMPTSSAAICIALGIGGLAGGAAAVGGAAQMVGFAVMSYKENRVSGLISQGLGTSMLQIPNIFKNGRTFIPPLIASAIVGPLATTVFHLHCSPAGSGMGTSGLVGVFETISVSMEAGVSTLNIVFGVILLFFVIPAVVCLALGTVFRKKQWIKQGDLAI